MLNKVKWLYSYGYHFSINSINPWAACMSLREATYKALETHCIMDMELQKTQSLVYTRLSCCCLKSQIVN